MEVFEYTNKGSRDENQDYVVHGSLPDGSGIFVVADGMGGYSEGAAAARIVGDALLDFIELNFDQYTPIELLKEAVPFANDALMLKRMAMAAKQMGCVVTVLIVSGDNAYFTWLGDSRIYMFRDGQEVYRTEDHSIVNEMAKIQSLNAFSYERYASIVTKSIMGNDPVDVAPIRKIKIEKGDVFVLCTDGFHKEIDMTKAFSYDDRNKDELDVLADNITDNYSFIKVVIDN